jgi:hypothetical protein
MSKTTIDATKSNRPLTAYERGWLDLEDASRPQIISGLCTVAAELSCCQIAERVAAFVACNPQFQCRMNTLSAPVWETVPAFHLEDHVIERSARMASTADILNELAVSAIAEGRSDRPPWRMILFRSQGLGRPIQSAIAFWAHHSLVDGLGARRFFEAIVDPDERMRRRETETETGGTADVAGKNVSSALQFSLNLTKDFLSRRPKDPFGRPPTPERRVLEMTFSRKQLQQLRNRTGTSLQELLLLIVSRGLSHYCQRRGPHPALRAIVPMTDLALAKRNPVAAHHDIGYLELPLGVVGIAQQVAKLRRGVEALQQRLENRAFPRLLSVLERLPNKVRYHASRRWSRNANLLVSLLPAGPVQPTVFGHRVTSVYALPAIATGQSLAIGIVVARECVHMAVVLDPHVVEDHEELVVDLETSLREVSAWER